MNGWIALEVKKSGVDQAVGASATKQIVSDAFRLGYGGATVGLRVDLVAASVTAATGITMLLQHSSGFDGSGNEIWSDVGAPKTTSITGNGEFSLLLNAQVATDAALMPLKTRMRVCVTTGAGDAVTVKSVRVMQEA